VLTTYRHHKQESDKSHESPSHVVDSISEVQTSNSVESSPSTTPFSSPRGSCNFRDLSQTHFDLDDIDNEVILGTDSTSNSITKSESKSKSNQKPKIKEKKENHTPRRKMSKSKSSAVIPKKTKSTTSNNSNKSEHDDNREMSLLEFLREGNFA
jgi:hypothetical protein